MSRRMLARHPRNITSLFVLRRTDGSDHIGEVIRQKLRRAGERAGLPVPAHAHLLRHTFGRALAANEVDVGAIRD